MKKLASLFIAIALLTSQITSTMAAGEYKLQLKVFLADLGVDKCTRHGGADSDNPQTTVIAAELYCLGIRSVDRTEDQLPGLAELLKMENTDGIPRSLLPYVAEVRRLDLELNTSPAAPVGTAEALQFLLQIQGFNIPRYAKTKERVYVDLTPGNTYTPAVEKALELNILSPISEKRLGLKNAVPRVEVLNLLYKLWLIHDQDNILFNPIQITVNPTQEIKTSGIGILMDIIPLIQQKYLYEEKIDVDKALYAAIKAFVAYFGDRYTIYFDPTENNSFQGDLQGQVEGIGAYVDQENGETVIVAPLANSPSEKSGLKSKDIILKVNGEAVSGMEIRSVISKIKGPAGTTVTLTIKRNGTTFDVEIVRAKVEIPAVTVDYIQEDIPYLKLTQFNSVAFNQMKATIEELKQKNIKGVIIDLRNNPGGYLHIVLQMLELFLPEDTPLVETSSRDGVTVTIADNMKIVPEEWKIVLITNKGSASASEIFAGALQENGRATIVGETTFGKGTVQELRDFSDKSALKMTIAEWKTGKETKIDGIGVKPDIEVADIQGTETDEQLERAISEIKK